LKNWQERFFEKLKDEEDKKKDLVLVEVKDSGEDCKCGTCDKPFKVEIYYCSGKLKQRLVCERCGVEFWVKT
jgi:hypothetical protein